MINKANSLVQPILARVLFGSLDHGLSACLADIGAMNNFRSHTRWLSRVYTLVIII